MLTGPAMVTSGRKGFKFNANKANKNHVCIMLLIQPWIAVDR